MTFGVQVFDSSGICTFDSTVENILFMIDERSIPGSSVGSGLTYSYPAYNGKKISAFLQTTSGDFSTTGGGLAVQSCRVTYPGGTPTVSVFFDNSGSSLPKADAYLTVFYTGSPQ